MENIIFEVVGGIGKNIVATAVVRAIKKQYPNKNIILQTAYPEVSAGKTRRSVASERDGAGCL